MLLLWLALLGAVLAQEEFGLGQKVMALGGGRWYPAKVVGIMEGGRYRVHYIGYPDTSEENLSPEYLRPVRNHAFNVGERVLVDWQNASYEADILDFSERGYLVHYLGWGSSYDTWVAESKVHPWRKTYSFRTGDQVQVLYGSSWYYATVMSVDSYGSYTVRYDNWGSDWDETVSSSRVRSR